MRIASFETRAVRIPREPGPSAPREEADYVTLTLRTDDGIEGIAYAGFASTLVTKALKEMVDAFAGATVGADPFGTEEIGAGLLRRASGGSPAGLITRTVAAIDVALWDIKGKAVGMPVWKLLGAGSGVVPTYASGFLWRHYDLDALATTASDLAAQGFTAMKFRMGSGKTAADELARLHTMREAVGDGVDLMVDINQGWDVNRAIAVGRGMAEYGLFWLEDPTHFQDYAGLARIADALDTPIAAGEYHYGIEPFRHMLEARSIDNRDGGSAARGRHHAMDEGGAYGGSVQPAGGDAPRAGDSGSCACRCAERPVRGAYAVGVRAVRGGSADQRGGTARHAGHAGAGPSLRRGASRVERAVGVRGRHFSCIWLHLIAFRAGA